jgi:tetratricopeptide (TPR) repeat protein
MIAGPGLADASFAGLDRELADQVRALPDLQHSESAMDHHLMPLRTVRLRGRRDLRGYHTIRRRAQDQRKTKGNAESDRSVRGRQSAKVQIHFHTIIRRSLFIVRACSVATLFLSIFVTMFASLPTHASSVDQLLQSNPQAAHSAGQSVEELIAQAEAAYDRRDHFRAIALYQQAVGMLPGSCFAHRARGMTLQIQGKLTDAIEGYRKALACDPEDYLAMEKLARLYEHMGEKIQEATELYRRASQLDPRSDHREDLATWASMLDNRLAGSNASAARLWNECADHVARAEWQRAGQCYSKVISLEPRFYQSFFSRAQVFTEMGDYEAAIRDLDAGLKLSPIYPGGYIYRGLAHEKLGDLERAARDFALAAETDGMDAAGYFHLGRMYEKRNQTGEALIYYRKALSLRPRADLLEAIQRQMATAERAPRQGPPTDKDAPNRTRKRLW